MEENNLQILNVVGFSFLNLIPTPIPIIFKYFSSFYFINCNVS